MRDLCLFYGGQKAIWLSTMQTEHRQRTPQDTAECSRQRRQAATVRCMLLLAGAPGHAVGN
jgi:hypothetical protein